MGHLAAVADSRQGVELSFAEIADLVGGLPASAYEHRAWWANSLMSQQVAWRHAGWRVDFVSLEHRRVRFVRHGAPRNAARESQPEATGIELPIDDGTPALDVRVRCACVSPARLDYPTTSWCSRAYLVSPRSIA
ncbi:DUF7662 domain-containing protein [Lentzea sp. E54]|uniref:DUF7662 domain-containing protein n=1 Tax=Lentzea xerophila TaxID=3435883 RepID=UPI003DA5E66B